MSNFVQSMVMTFFCHNEILILEGYCCNNAIRYITLMRQANSSTEEFEEGHATPIHKLVEKRQIQHFMHYLAKLPLYFVAPTVFMQRHKPLNIMQRFGRERDRKKESALPENSLGQWHMKD
ncbi:hypothetical protein VNO77_24460 [Canavalia gladiata]|uniref:Uncharacterized protein n=1 Tax=Canavalia gladiata TaxID=3824 RepID=A0AAN9L6B9_CANGL